MGVGFVQHGVWGRASGRSCQRWIALASLSVRSSLDGMRNREGLFQT